MTDKHRVWARAVAVCLSVLMGAGWATPASGINIVIQLQDNGENPSWDSNGTKLEAIFNEAALIWERLLPDSGTYEIDVYYGDLSDGTLGQWQPECCGDNDILIDPTPRKSNGDLLGWFVDPTPSDHSEFDFSNPAPAAPTTQGMTLFNDLTAGEITDWFFGNNPPGVLEIGYRGNAIDTLPNENGVSIAADVADMLSVVLHEIGHELGINSADIEDGWELTPVHVGGVTNVNIDETNGDGGGHYEIPMSLMNPVTPSGVRVLPSAVDVLGVAWDEGFANVDLQRKHFIGGSDWNTAGNWIGARLPDSSDSAYLVHGGNVTLSATANTRDLILDDGSDLLTGSQALNAPGVITINGAFLGLKSRLHVQTGSTVTTGTVNIFGGTLEMEGGTVDANLVNVLGLSTLRGNGQVLIRNTLFNDGLIKPEGGTLTLEDNSGPGIGDDAYIDLDGPNETGVVDVTAGDLTIIGLSRTDYFDGIMTIGPGRTFTGAIVLGTQGTINLNGSGLSTPNLAGPGDTAFDGTVNIDKIAIISSARAWYRLGTVNIPDADDALSMNSTIGANFSGGNFLGNGTLIQNSNITVLSSTDVDVATFDWGNGTTTNARTLTISPGKTLTVNSTSTGESDNLFRGDLHVDSGILDVNFASSWRLPSEQQQGATTRSAGRLFLVNSGGGIPTVTGQSFVVDNLLDVSGGDAEIEADLTINVGATVNVANGSTLRLKGSTILGQAFYLANGEIEQQGDFDVRGIVEINNPTFDWGNSNLLTQTNTILINPAAILSVKSTSTGTAGNPFHGIFDIIGSGWLNVEFSWELPDAVGSFPNTKPRGVINMSYPGFGNSPTISGDRMIVSGDLNVTAPDARVYVRTSFEATGAVDITEADDQLMMAYDGPFNGVEFRGASVTGTGTLAQATSFVVLEDTTLDVATFDWGNSPTPIDTHLLKVDTATLTINSTSLGDPDGQYRGPIQLNSGHLTVNTPSGWALPDGSAIGPVTGSLEMNDSGSGSPTVNGTFLTVGGTLAVGTGTGIINSELILLSTTTLDIADGATLDLRGPSVTYQSGITYAGTGTLRHSANGGIFNLTDFTPAHFEQNGTMTIFNTTTTPRFDAATNLFTPNSNTFLISNLTLRGTTTVQQGSTFSGDGTLTVNNNATLDGEATIGVDFVNNGHLRPGSSAGLLQFTDNFTQNSHGTLYIELAGGGGIAGVDFDALVITGDASTRGTLDVQLINGFTPTFGDMFTFLTAASINNTFADIFGLDIGDGLLLDLFYGSNNLTLRVISSLAGDLNGDGFVGITDLNIVLGNWNQNVAPGDPLLGDASGDGFVGIADLNVVLGNWNAGTPPNSQANIPEPATTAVLLLSGMNLLLMRRRL